jgi:hypothetical protein
MPETNVHLNKIKYVDARYLPRWLARNHVQYHLPKESTLYPAFTRDLSYSGTCLITDSQNPTASVLWLKIMLAPAKSIYVKGQVIWTVLDGKEKQLGVKFEYISDPDRNLIYEHAFEINKTTMINKWFSGWTSIGESVLPGSPKTDQPKDENP